MNRLTLILAAIIVLVGDSSAAELREIRLDTHQFLLGPYTVLDPKAGILRPAQSWLLTDEMGATDFRQAVTLSERVRAYKVFLLQKEDIRDPEVFIYGVPKYVEINRKYPHTVARLHSTGWSRLKIPAEQLGWNFDIIEMSKGGQLLFEPSRKGGRSHLSLDGGASWSQSLGAEANQPGEYLVRLRLKTYGPDGRPADWAMSGVLDLWGSGPDGLACPGTIVSFKSLDPINGGQPEKTIIRPYLRTGSTPAFDEKTWTPWDLLVADRKVEAMEAGHRWAQLKFELGVSDQTIPRLPRQLTLSYEFKPDAPFPEEKFVVSAPADGQRIATTAVPFTYQAPSPRLKLLRDRYKLDEVIASGKTEMEQLMLLRHWVRNQWHTGWEGGAASWMPPWDAHIILESKDQPDCLTMCTHYAAVFTQCCLALGWNARYCILDHHCVSEVFVNQHNKWVMMDTGNSKQRADVGLHFERGGVPLSALELHLAYHQKKTDGITVHFTPKALAEKVAHLCRPEPVEPTRPAKKAKKVAEKGPRPDVIPLAELKDYPVCQIENYRRYAFPGRNNYLDSLLPGELYQGWSSYFYDGYWWVGDSPDAPKLSPEYSKHLDPARPQDIDWSLNWTRIHLARTAKAGELQVDLETLTPNFARFEMLADGKWKPTPGRFVWNVAPGKNELRVRSVNQFGRPGIEASVQVKRGN